MSTADMHFIQKVALDGYHWQVIKHPKSGRMIPALYRGKNNDLPGPDAPVEDLLDALDEEWGACDTDAPVYREYSVADCPGLYRTFASLELTSASILQFADEFGYIGVGVDISTGGNASPFDSLAGCSDTVEFLHDWANEIRMMKSSVETLNALDRFAGTNPAALSKMLSHREGNWHVKSEYLPCYKAQGDIEWIDLAVWSGEHPSRFDDIASGDIVRAATEFLIRIANSRLEGRVSSRLIWDGRQGKTALAHRPASLLGAMWLQFAEELTGESKCRPCIECGTVFEMVRSDKMFCSEACQKRYGRRKAKQADGT